MHFKRSKEKEWTSKQNTFNYRDTHDNINLHNNISITTMHNYINIYKNITIAELIYTTLLMITASIFTAKLEHEN